MSNDFKNFEKILPEFITERVDDNARQCIRWKFSNGYGASLVCHPMSYGGSAEFAIIKGDKLCYDTPITSDVISHVTAHEVMGYLAQLRGM